MQGWVEDHLHQFHIYGKDYGISYEGGIGFPDNPFRVVIDDFAFDVSDRFTYEYNFFEHWLHDLRVEAIHEDSTLKTPFCMSGHGMPGATAADEADKTLAFLNQHAITVQWFCYPVFYFLTEEFSATCVVAIKRFPPA